MSELFRSLVLGDLQHKQAARPARFPNVRRPNDAHRSAEARGVRAGTSWAGYQTEELSTPELRRLQRQNNLLTSRDSAYGASQRTGEGIGIAQEVGRELQARFANRQAARVARRRNWGR